MCGIRRFYEKYTRTWVVTFLAFLPLGSPAFLMLIKRSFSSVLTNGAAQKKEEENSVENEG